MKMVLDKSNIPIDDGRKVYVNKPVTILATAEKGTIISWGDNNRFVVDVNRAPRIYDGEEISLINPSAGGALLFKGDDSTLPEITYTSEIVHEKGVDRKRNKTRRERRGKHKQ
jgi:hypothetical protein